MTRNNTANKIHVAATELPQLLSQNTPLGLCLQRQYFLELDPHHGRKTAGMDMVGPMKKLRLNHPTYYAHCDYFCSFAPRNY